MPAPSEVPWCGRSAPAVPARGYSGGVGGGERRALVLICGYALAVSTSYTNHGPVLGLIAAEFSLTAAQSGVVATAFYVGSALTMLWGGLVADRLGPRRVVTWGFGLVVAGTLAAGAASPTFPLLLGWKWLSGVGAGLGFAAGAAYTRGIFTARGAHLAQGLYGASFLAGSGGALLFMPPLAGSDGDWRRAFVVSGGAIALVWLAWTGWAPRGHAGGSRLAGFSAAVASRNTWLLALCHMCGFGLAILVSTWATTYLAHSFGLPLTQAGALGALLSLTGIVARSTGGAILERGVRPVRLIRGALALVAGGLLAMALPLGSLGVAAVGLLLTGLGAGLPYAAIFNGAAASAPRGPSSAQALVGWGATLFTVLGPPLLGAVLDATGSFAGGFSALAAFSLLVLASTFWLRPFSFSTSR